MRRLRPYGDKLRRFQEQWDLTDHQGKVNLCHQYNVSYDTGKRWRMSEIDERLQPPELADIAPDQIIINLPPVELKEYIPKKMGKGDPETQVLVIGDDHAGEKTPSFNKEIYKKRFDTLFQSVMTITELHRNMYPLNELVIIDVGDNVQGENPYQGSTIGAVEFGAVVQVYDLALPTLVNLLSSFKQEFKTVKFYGVRGNHGKYSRTAPQTSNWDLALYRALKNTKLPKGIEINYSDEFNDIVEIEGFRFFIFHGDQVKATMGVPYFALVRAVKDWYASFGRFPYAICGHFHREDYLRITSRTNLLINGSLVSDDPFALEVMKTSTIPIHWTFGVHRRIGLSWLYKGIVDYDFLPEKVGDR